MTKRPPLPMLLPLLALCLVPALLHSQPVQPEEGKLPTLGVWQLKAHATATVTPLPGTKTFCVQPKQGAHSAYALDSSGELRLEVTQSNGAPESVTLSNALEVAPQNRQRSCLRFRLRATKTPTVPLTLQSAGKVFWSGAVPASSEWKEACLPVSLASCKTAQAVLTFQLGAQTGELALADVRLEPAPEEQE